MSAHALEVLILSAVHEIMNITFVVSILNGTLHISMKASCALAASYATHFNRIAPARFYSCLGVCKFGSMAALHMSLFGSPHTTCPKKASCLPMMMSPAASIDW